MIYCLIVFLILFISIDLINNKKIITPCFVFNVIWLVTVVLYQFKLSYLQDDLSYRTILILYVCVLSYNITLLFCKINEKILKKKFNKTENMLPKKMCIRIKEIKKKISRILNKNSIEDKIKIAKYIVIVLFIVEIIYSKGVPLIWKFMNNGKIYFDFGIPSINGALYGLVICLGAYSFFLKSKDKFIYLAIGILIISRQIILSILIEAVIFEICGSDNIKKSVKKILILIIIAMIGFNLIGNFRSGNNVMNDVFQAKENYEKLPSTLKWIYSYMTFSLGNFNELVKITNGGVNYGTSILTDLVPTVILNIVKVKPINSFVFLKSLNFNVSTYLQSIYLDFGIIGIAIFNILIALLGNKMYCIMLKNKTSKNILLYAVYIHNIIFLFFINMFLYLPIIAQFVYIILIFSEGEEDENICSDS